MARITVKVLARNEIPPAERNCKEFRHSTAASTGMPCDTGHRQPSSGITTNDTNYTKAGFVFFVPAESRRLVFPSGWLRRRASLCNLWQSLRYGSSLEDQ